MPLLTKRNNSKWEHEAREYPELSPSANMTHEVIIEFHQVGQQMKVTAVDPITTTEVSIFGPVMTPREELVRLAVRKLDFVISKKGNLYSSS